MIERIGRFKRDGNDIWWAGVRKSNALFELQGKLINKLIVAGFSLESRKYSPHITLGRKVASNVEPRWIEPFGEIVSKFELMNSERINGKLTYTPICAKDASPMV
jgi:2'-5' RNA ligase